MMGVWRGCVWIECPSVCVRGGGCHEHGGASLVCVCDMGLGVYSICIECPGYCRSGVGPARARRKAGRPRGKTREEA